MTTNDSTEKDSDRLDIVPGTDVPADRTPGTSRADAPVASFTPGPWFAHEQRSTRGESLGWIINHGHGRIGWSSYATAIPNEGERPPCPISTANAHLIAAAPDLYVALKMCLPTQCQATHHASPNYRDGAPCGRCAYCVGAAALAKAGWRS